MRFYHTSHLKLNFIHLVMGDLICISKERLFFHFKNQKVTLTFTVSFSVHISVLKKNYKVLGGLVRVPQRNRTKHRDLAWASARVTAEAEACGMCSLEAGEPGNPAA